MTGACTTRADADGGAPSAARTTSRSAATICCMPRRYSATSTCGSPPAGAGAGRGGERDGRELVGGRQRARHPLAVGGAHLAAVEQVRRPGGHGRGVDRLGVAAVEQHRGVDRHPGRGQLGQRQQEPADPVVAGGVAGHRGVRAVAEDLADELGQHPPGPGLDEHPRAGRVHRLDLLAERHRRRDLAGEALAHGVGVAVVGRGGGVRPHREAGHLTSTSPRWAARASAAARSRGVWKAQATGQPAGAIPALGQPRHGLGHLVGRPRDHALVGGVVVGHDHVGPGGERAPRPRRPGRAPRPWPRGRRRARRRGWPRPGPG